MYEQRQEGSGEVGVIESEEVGRRRSIGKEEEGRKDGEGKTAF